MKFRPHYLASLLGMVSLLGGSLAIAAPAPAPTSTSLKALGAALNKRQYQGLRKVGSTDPFYDHALAVLARHEREAATQALQKKNLAEASRLSRQAQERWGRIQLAVAGGPWMKLFPNELGQLEVLQARLLQLEKKDSQARVVFERAFDRMALSLLGWQDVDAYLRACGKWEDTDAPTSCTLWGRRLLGVFPKASVERRELESRWKTVIEGLERPLPSTSSGRVNQSYKSPDADQEAWEEILPRVLERNLRWSSPLFEKFLEKFPRSGLRQRARYWWALALLESGPDKKAFGLLEQIARENPFSYYGLLAARQLGREPAEFISADPPKESDRDPKLHPSELLALERAEKLLKAGLPELAGMELREIRVRDSLDTSFLVYLARLHSESGSHLGAFTVMTELVARGASAATTQWAAEIIFPVEHWGRIQDAATQKQVDPLWVLSLIKQESAFEDSAQSGVGAVGLMQVMPTTAVDVDPSVLRQELSVRERNVVIGTSYMAYLQKRFKSNLTMATAGYNAGPQAVDRWLKDKQSDRGLIDFIEAIPYRETRDYVGSIIRNYYWYSRKLKPEPRDPAKGELEVFWKVIPQNGSA